MKSVGKSKEELFAEFTKMFPLWAEKATDYKKIGSRALCIFFKTGTVGEVSRVFLYYDENNWQFGTKMWRKVPNHVRKKMEERGKKK